MQEGLRADIPALPPHMSNRPLDKRGYPVPYFVAWVDGVPDFRVADSHKLDMCVNFEFCWLCGKPLGSHRVFVVGPMCTVNRISSEPPSHRACAEFAAAACPHMVRPTAKRREANLPEDRKEPRGIMVMDNPGAVALWESSSYSIDRTREGVIVDIGEPDAVDWWTKGHKTTRRDEVLPAFEASVTRLRKMTAEHYAHDPTERAAAMLALGEATAQAMQFLPPR